MLKKIKTKSLILFLAVLSLSLILSINNNANANMFNKFKKGFYFEKYKTAEEAQKALLELHPIGSDVGELVRTLEGAGAVDRGMDPNDKNIYFKEVGRSINYKDLMYFNYKYQSFSSFFPKIRKIFIEYKEGKILNIFLYYYQGE